MGYNSTKHNLVALLELINEFVLDPPLKIEELSDYLKQLPDREQQVLNFYYRDGLTLRENPNKLTAKEIYQNGFKAGKAEMLK